MNVKIEGIKDDLDVVAIVKAFEAFRDGVQLVSDKADKIIVELAFDASVSPKVHYSFQQDELISLSGVRIIPENKKLGFSCVYGVNDKIFFADEAELINVHNVDDTGTEICKSLKYYIDEEFKKAFTDLKINSPVVFQAMIRNNPPLIDIINNPDSFLEDIEKKGTRVKAYSGLEKFGRY